MNRVSRQSGLATLAVVMAFLAAACGSAQVVLTENTLERSASGPSEPAPSEPAPDTGESTVGEAQAIPEQAPPEPAQQSEPADAGSSLSGVSLLSQAAGKIDQGSYRFEAFFSMAFRDGSVAINFAPDQPLSTGEASGEVQYVLTDLRPLFEEVFSVFEDVEFSEETFGRDLTVEVIVDGTTMYMRAPMFAGLLDGPRGADLPPEFGQLGEGWGVVDLASIPGLDALDLAGLAGGQSGSSPAQIVALLDAAGSAVEDLGPETVRGVDTTRLGVEVGVLALLEALGLDLDSLGGIQGAVLDFTLPLDVFVDGEARVRRVTMSLSFEDIAALLPDEDVPSGVDFQFSTTIDFFDFGADITIDLPDEADIVGDFTELFAGLAEPGA